ncbi:pilin [Lysinibacillus capsici]|uniref:pilin n=1 Tax=Lysinibacillus capsici TaxID=2115968 RepID=UPI003081B513|nr:TrbC/VirB2 family protein [Lysinibacillus capsici]
MDNAITLINSVATDIQKLAPAVAGIALIIIGLIWMFAKDPQKKESAQSWMVNVFIGFAIVYLAASLVTWMTEKTVFS